MFGTSGDAEAGLVKVFITNNSGCHSPEVLTDITCSQIFDPLSAPAAVDEIKSELGMVYKVLLTAIHRIFSIAKANQIGRIQIASVLARDIATLLDSESRKG
jgi:hypothetical protein